MNPLHAAEQLRLKHREKNENDLRAVAVAKDSIFVGFKYYRKLIWHEDYSCSTSYDNFPSKAEKCSHYCTSYKDVIFFVTKC